MAETDTKTARADQRVKRYMWGALSVGLVPLPLVDTVLLVGLQLKMLHSLAKLCGVTFSSQLGTLVIASVLGGGIPVSLSATVTRVVKGIPIYGYAPAILSTSLLSGASTYALGKVFIQHFESGNTLLTFDPQRVREYYAQQFAKGKEEIRESFIGVRP